MECKITSTKNRKRADSAWTLVELIVAISLGGGVLFVVFTGTFSLTRTFQTIENHVTMSQGTHHALSTISRDIRNAADVSSFQSTNLVLKLPDNSTVTYEYVAETKEFFRHAGGESQVLLECDELVMEAFQRTPQAGSFEQFPAATLQTCKLIQLTWTTSMDMLLTPTTTLDMKSAKFILRNKS